jgi:UDP-glucose 4-epimerase
MTDKVLVTGGAGYAGAHACKALARAGFTPVVFDNLSTGWADAVKWGPLVKGDLLDRAGIAAALDEHRPLAVMHFAALSLVGEARINIAGRLRALRDTLQPERQTRDQRITVAR